MEAKHDFGISSSPQSSEEIGSFRGTPETKLTAFSPEEFRTGTKTSARRSSKLHVPPTYNLNEGQITKSASYDTIASSQDPFFITKGGSSNRAATAVPKLSPTASDFEPSGQLNTIKSTLSTTAQGVVPLAIPSHNATSAIGVLAASSVPDIPQTKLHLKSFPSSFTTESLISPVSQGSFSSSFGSITVVNSPRAGPFSTDGDTSRYLKIGNVAARISVKELEETFNTCSFSSLKQVVLAHSTRTGSILVHFSDIRDAHKAYSKAQAVRHDWHIQYTAATDFARERLTENASHVPVSVYEGQVVIKAEHAGPRERFDVRSIGHLIKEILENYGDIMAFELSLAEPPVVAVRAEFFDTGSADSALVHLDGFKIGGCTLSIVHYKPDIDSLASLPGARQGPLIIGRQDVGVESALSHISLNLHNEVHRDDSSNPAYFLPGPPSDVSRQSSMYHQEAGLSRIAMAPATYDPSYAGFATRQNVPWNPCFQPYPLMGIPSPSWTAYGHGTIGQERELTPFMPYRAGQPYQNRGSIKQGGRQHNDYASGHHNVVDIDRIRQGTDVRTTIMLRNIPNKIDQAMLKDIVDETSRAKYDFMYLRIDFANNCNVGYAFINFEDPYFIIDFVKARAGNRWNRFNSDKVAEVSYATIQGRDCLIQKFRNSSVMLEHPSFRPKIFHTGSGPTAGTEDKFPGPDNPSKMRRSVENAEHVGLFAPRAGQNFRDEQRRRRSQYDRGTRLAEIEDSYDFDPLDHLVNAKNYYGNNDLARNRIAPGMGY